jgi:endonuclease YncB( thermonuclease family)
MLFKVKRVIDGDTFEVTPKWKWKDKEGDIIRASKYNTPEENEPGYENAKKKLKELIEEKEVELINPLRITYGRLLCDVIYNGTNLADNFPEYRQ